MSTFRQLTYICLDKLKLVSNDSHLQEEHILYLLSTTRAFLLKQRYGDIKKQIPESNYQTLCLELEKIEAIDGLPCEGGYYLRTTKEVPATLPLGTTRLYTSGSFYKGDITFVSRDRMRYVGHNDWMKNIIYASLDPSNRIYMNSQNSQFLYLKEAKLTAVFEDSEAASELSCDNDGDAVCDIMEREFPIEDALIAPLIELVVKELQPVVTAPEDEDNDADDSLSTKGKD
jgi:hypothetical protein